MAETILAFDFGEKRIGVAVGNDFLRQAQDLKTLHAETVDARFMQIAALIAEWLPQRLVVGMPQALEDANADVNDNAADSKPAAVSKTAQRARRFANQLNGRFGLPVVLVDERYSSQEADAEQRSLRSAGLARRSAANDQRAAQVILQRYLDALPVLPNANQENNPQNLESSHVV
jgi:putative Holliday junction resolvase